MFSLLNFSNSLLTLTGETVVDLFSGIGYFSLPYLVHSKASFLHACEWNPAAVRAIKMNMERNKIGGNKFQIHEGNNRKVCPRGVADRVNLGLIPSSEISYKTACLALKPDSGGIMHIHGNVDRRSPPSNDCCENENVRIKVHPGFNCKYSEWHGWALDTASKIGICFLEERPSSQYSIELVSMNHVKSYAPKVDHLVLDLNCCPIIK